MFALLAPVNNVTFIWCRDEIEKERQKKVHEQLRAEGKTDQARADLARLAIIRQEREQAAKRREAETKGMSTWTQWQIATLGGIEWLKPHTHFMAPYEKLQLMIPALYGSVHVWSM